MGKSRMECENVSSRRSCHSISILVVDDDTTCLSFVAALLKKLKYEVVTAKHPNDALCALRIKGDAFDLVVSDVHMPDMNGFELQEAIALEFNLPVVLMSVDSKEVVVSKGMKGGAAFFISKPVSPNDLKDLWQFASMRKKSSHAVNGGKISNSKRKPASEVGTKKPKVIWTNALHCRFLEAIRTIGLHRSVPKKILEAMNVPGLTRENVASHLQKYRIFLKRVSDASYKLEFGGDDGFLSNYSSSTTSNSLLMINRLQNFGDLPAADTHCFSYHVPPSSSLVDRSHHQVTSVPGGLLEPNITTAAVNSHASTLGLNPGGTSSQVGADRDFHSNEWQNSIADLDQLPQYLGDSCFVGERQHLSDGVGEYQNDLLLKPSDLPLIEDVDNGGLFHDQSAFCSMDHLPAFDNMATQQPLKVTHPDSNHSDQMNIDNLVQHNGCDYAASFFFYGGMNRSSYNDQPVYQTQGSTDCEETGTTSQFNKALESTNEVDDDDGLESLLAYGPFGEDPIQTLEGI